MPAIIYRAVTESPEGWIWHCAWCHATATTPASSWDSAVDALMDVHTQDCGPYQLWVQGLERRSRQWASSRRTRGHKDKATQETLFERL